jgi:hypothetical protein
MSITASIRIEDSVNSDLSGDERFVIQLEDGSFLTGETAKTGELESTADPRQALQYTARWKALYAMGVNMRFTGAAIRRLEDVVKNADD